MFYLGAAPRPRASGPPPKIIKIHEIRPWGPFFVVLFFGFVFGTVLGGFGVRIEDILMTAGLPRTRFESHHVGVLCLLLDTNVDDFFEFYQLDD